MGGLVRGQMMGGLVRGQMLLRERDSVEKGEKRKRDRLKREGEDGDVKEKRLCGEGCVKGKWVMWRGREWKDEGREERDGKKKRKIRSHLSRVADPDTVQQSKKLGGLGRLDDLGGRGAFVWLLLPAPYHQFTEEHGAGEVLEGRERERERRTGGEGQREGGERKERVHEGKSA